MALDIESLYQPASGNHLFNLDAHITLLWIRDTTGLDSIDVRLASIRMEARLKSLWVAFKKGKYTIDDDKLRGNCKISTGDNSNYACADILVDTPLHATLSLLKHELRNTLPTVPDKWFIMRRAYHLSCKTTSALLLVDLDKMD